MGHLFFKFDNADSPNTTNFRLNYYIDRIEIAIKTTFYPGVDVAAFLGLGVLFFS